ncbi:pyruvate kinase [Terriglobus saanensis]|uniref:Pyruvate kinase n=1 Tax=Terriglobus saanensis (strain ATCC BAA-1853 / DSM 23119 / SP1PR4) TaxID=401053 RepID=E8V849_TERSS|nr:pyruvate kinase [Terriglobus saanensis]ADV84031.1 pyruvate kinase [Terriglobus saanensis SP1PR4]
MTATDGVGFLGRSGRSAKIVATLGPACSTEEVFTQLVRAGLDVARLNFSHGSHEQKAELIAMVRKVSASEGKAICILADLQGPKIRTGKLVDHKAVLLHAGELLTITPEEILGTAQRVGTTFKTLAENLEPGSTILLSDGLIELKVVTIQGGDVTCEIVNGGMLGENKGINLPGIPVKVPSLTEKDEEDLVFCIGQKVDAVAVSFVRTAADVRHTKERVAALGSTAWVVAKLEKPQAIENLEEILEATDGLMVARGDLGVEVPPEKVPAIQKHIIRRAAVYRKPVITATQMLESMIENPRPTRAEASDVANAVYDGTDAVMLSAETAAGKYPVQSVAMMAKIIVETETQIAMEPMGHRHGLGHGIGHAARARLSVAETICECMAHSADDLDLGAIAIFTESGATARLLSKYRPNARVFALCPDVEAIGRMVLLWGVTPILCRRYDETDKLVNMAEDILEAAGHVKKGEILGIVAGTATRTGATNFMRLHKVGDR